ncbi:hypothetical protein LSH36_842g00010 [Paralvinella palmiformis]|uniref:Fork-head domain-containing protein n=1 Tax=Paralvinella palmiformis TaxID=53620 RepID=A0AAD9IYR3_9ANNE|nr:hypothetical protein LSH36_842g00010 [Paralvinella palmiformis]
MEHHVPSSDNQMEMPDLDPNFEPQFRARSNTWPLRPREIVKSEEDSRSTPTGSEAGDAVPDGGIVTSKESLGLKAKSSSRRNAWGNLSYADLITKAIESSPEKRLTLSQIYDWMVQNVPYFKDKGDTNSSAGWKVRSSADCSEFRCWLSCHVPTARLGMVTVSCQIAPFCVTDFTR